MEADNTSRECTGPVSRLSKTHRGKGFELLLGFVQHAVVELVLDLLVDTL